MAKLNRKQIQQQVRELLQSSREGLRWAEILRAIGTAHPETPAGSVQGAVRDLFQTDTTIAKVAPGTYQLAIYQDAQSSHAVAQDEAAANEPVVVDTPDQPSMTLLEADFYASFADWLADGADEVNIAIPLGGSVLKGKWGTPDVIGVRRARTQDLLKFEPQIVSAEIKIDPAQPVVAFGQAVAYRLFSHKSYIVVPGTTSYDDLNRLKSLCSIHGVGLVTFALDKDAPDFTILVLPVQASPDMFYANGMLRRLLEAAPDKFDALFGG